MLFRNKKKFNTKKKKTIMSQLTQKSEYFSFLPDLGWEVKLVHPF